MAGKAAASTLFGGTGVLPSGTVSRGLPGGLADGVPGSTDSLGDGDVETLPVGAAEVPPAAGWLMGTFWPAQAVAISSIAPVPTTFAEYLMSRRRNGGREGLHGRSIRLGELPERHFPGKVPGRGLGGRLRASRNGPPSVLEAGQPWRRTTVRVPSGSASARGIVISLM
ncbi:hypothetical protein Amsp01_083190 [Amycolatopsis sp. NBRC 101858]|nr:hypothetical protein Amsp01_083190 [Amycolatopsis sp. NBRC 101858]